MRREQITLQQIKKEIIAELPLNAFSPQPLRALYLMPLLSSIFALSSSIYFSILSLPLQILSSMLIGILYASMFFLGHEVSHGAIIRNKTIKYILLFVTFSIFLLSPHLWQVWHVYVHHNYTNRKGYDPDNYGSADELDQMVLPNIVLRIAPGSSHWLSILFLPTWFTIFSQYILWVGSKRCKGFERLFHSRAVIESYGILLIWILFALYVGLKNSLLLILLPMMVANSVVLSYFITQHSLRPLSDINNPLDNTISLTTPRLFDSLFFNFSHHVEHHLFPSLRSSYLPSVRKWLRENASEKYLAPPYWKAVSLVFKTPRIYNDNNTLIDPLTSRRICLSDINKML